MPRPAQQDNISELSPLLKAPVARSKLDKLGRKFAKGFRTSQLLTGTRPLMRKARR
jgi:hypothetical protein